MILRALAFLSFLSPAAAGATCSDRAVEIRGDFGTARFTVDVADTPETQRRGLMFVEDLPSSRGMLFVYSQPRPARFWMKNTLIPLDMLFAGADGTIRRIHENAVPHDETTIEGGDNILAILEINGGLAGRLGISEGDVMRHPAFDQSVAAWPCES